MKTLSPAYHAYINSDRWQRTRRAVLQRASYRCERCGSAGPLDVHHLSYARFGHEDLSDLRALCRPCHRWAELVKTVKRRLRAAGWWLKRTFR